MSIQHEWPSLILAQLDQVSAGVEMSPIATENPVVTWRLGQMSAQVLALGRGPI